MRAGRATLDGDGMVGHHPEAIYHRLLRYRRLAILREGPQNSPDFTSAAALATVVSSVDGARSENTAIIPSRTLVTNGFVRICWNRTGGLRD